MKKLFAVLLAAGLCAGLTLPLAAEETTAALGKTEGDQSISVSADFVPAKVQDVISVDVVWGDLTFTYQEGDKGDWDPEDHVYVGGESGTWSANKPEITLRNHSNVHVLAEFAFASADGVGAVGKFYQKQPSVTDEGYTYTALKTDEQSLTLKSAVGTDKTEPPTGAVCFGITGGMVTKDQTIGTITVTVKKDSRTLVYSAEALVAEIEKIETSKTGGTVVLGCDIDLWEIGHRFYPFANIGSAEAPFVLDLGGNTLIGGIYVSGNSNVIIQNGTLDERRINETVHVDSPSPSRAELLLDHVTVLTEDFVALSQFYGTVTVKDSALYGSNNNGITVRNIGGSLTLEGKVTVQARILPDQINSTDFLITLKTGGTYSINGKSVAVGQTDLIVDAAAVTAGTYADWMYKSLE